MEGYIIMMEKLSLDKFEEAYGVLLSGMQLQVDLEPIICLHLQIFWKLRLSKKEDD